MIIDIALAVIMMMDLAVMMLRLKTDRQSVGRLLKMGYF